MTILTLIVPPPPARCRLTATVEQQQQYAIIEYISHLVSEQFDQVPNDLVNLGFVPEAKRDAVADTGVATALSYIFRQLASGGGAKKIMKRVNVNDIGVEVQAIQEKYGNILQVPAYFAYILRAFSVLEGIGLQNDPDYKVSVPDDEEQASDDSIKQDGGT